MTRLAVFTTGSRNRMAMARALMATLRQHHPEADQFICIGDDPAGLVPPPGCQLLAGADIGVPGWRNACFAYDVMSLNCLLKPYTFLHLVETLGYDRGCTSTPTWHCTRRCTASPPRWTPAPRWSSHRIC